MDNHNLDVLNLISTYVCETQSSLSQHNFMVNEKHKNLRECFCQIQSDNREVLYEDKEKLKMLLADIDGYFMASFSEFFEKTYKYALVYFNERSLMSPRITLKLVVEDQLGTLIKLPESFLSDKNTRINENTGFHKIAKGEKHFFCNNIPDAIRKIGYVNARIDQSKASIFSMKDSIERELSYKDKFDDDWVKCWNSVNRLGSEISTESPPATCYKSTIVIPISLATKKLEKEFMRKLEISESSERALFGFLCFDHININYFNESEDINFTQIVADILSLPLISQLTFTQFSHFYQTAKELSCS
jgi:hypothetical protein